MRDRRQVGIGETLLAAVLWGTSFPVILYGIRLGVSPLLFVFLRSALAAPLMLAVARLRGEDALAPLRRRAIWLLGLVTAVGFVFQIVGQSYTDASVAALLINMSFLVTVVGAVLFLGERLSPLKAVGILLAVVGTVLLTTGGNLALVSRGALTGDVLCLFGAVTSGTYILYNKKKSDEGDWSPFAASTGIVVATAVFSSPALVLIGGAASFGPGTWGVVAYTAVFNTAAPFALYQAGLKYLSATSSAMVLVFEIITAVVISVSFLGESLDLAGVVGAVAILVSIFVVSRGELGSKSLSVGDADTNGAQVL